MLGGLQGLATCKGQEDLFNNLQRALATCKGQTPATQETWPKNSWQGSAGCRGAARPPRTSPLPRPFAHTLTPARSYTAKAGCQELCRCTAAKYLAACEGLAQPPSSPLLPFPAACPLSSRQRSEPPLVDSACSTEYDALPRLLPRSFATAKCLALQLTCKERAGPAKKKGPCN